MRVILCLRFTRDWKNIDINNLLDQSNPFYKCYNFFKNIKIWKRHINPNYFEYRAKLKDIAMSQWTLPWFDYNDNFLENLNDDDIVVPIEDDDWFHPDIEKFLIKNSKNYDYGCWNAIVNNTSNEFNIHDWHRFHDEICTNSYSFRVSFLRSQNQELVNDLIKNHYTTLNIAKSMNLKIMDCRDSIMSVYNRHPGSHSILNHIVREEGFFSLFPKNKPMAVPHCYKWAASGIELVRDLICSLEIKANEKRNIKFFN